MLYDIVWCLFLVINNMSSEYPTKIGRIGTILTLIGSLIWVQWPIEFAQFDPFKILAVLAALVLWISVEAADWKNHNGYNINSLNEDVMKLNSLLSIIDRSTYYTLRETPIETYIYTDDYNGLSSLDSHHGLDIFPFHNELLQEKYEEFCLKSNKFQGVLWGLYTSDGTGRATWIPNGYDYRDEEKYENKRQKTLKLSQDAYELSKDWESFLTIAKKELKGNSVGVASYLAQ